MRVAERNTKPLNGVVAIGLALLFVGIRITILMLVEVHPD